MSLQSHLRLFQVLLFLLLSVFRKGSHAAQAGLEANTLLSPPSKCWDYTTTPMENFQIHFNSMFIWK